MNWINLLRRWKRNRPGNSTTLARKIILKHFEIEDFDNMDVKVGCWARPCDQEMIKAYAANGPAITMIKDDKIIMCLGVGFGMWAGIGDLWFIPSKYVVSCPLEVFTTAKNFIDEIIKESKLWRVQAMIAESEIKWIEELGFEREGLLRKFGPNKEDKYIYGRVEQ